MARKEKKYHFIYKTTNLLNGKYYIGVHSTNNMEDGYMGSGNRLRLAIRKHGKENFKREIIEYCATRQELYLREEEVVNLNEIAKIECMNLRVGGEGGGTPQSAKVTNEKRWIENREANIKIASDNFRRLWEIGVLKGQDVSGDKNGMFGKTHSDETKKKMSEKGSGNSNSQYSSCWITKEGVNKKIKKVELDIYIKQGWAKGRKMK
jgi:group I intron endonuclease